MNAEPSRTEFMVPTTLLSHLWLRAGLLGRLRLRWPRRPHPDKNMQALAAIGEDELASLSEAGLRLRREARRRSSGAWLSAGIVVLVSGTGGVAEPVCRPALTIARTHLSAEQGRASARTWTAVVSVDAARCAPDASGDFELVVSRLKENGPELQFRERFAWRAPTVTAEISFSADEAVERAWIESIAACPCGASGPG